MVSASMALGRVEHSVNTFVRKIHEERCVTTFDTVVQPMDRVVGDFVGDIAFLWYWLAVDV